MGLNPHLLEMAKTAARFRQNFQVVLSPQNQLMPGMENYQLQTKAQSTPVGAMFVDRTSGTPRIVSTQIAEKLRDLGLGKKLYGEVMKAMPGGQLNSDATVSTAAARVWRSLQRNSGSYTVQQHERAAENPFGMTLIPNPPTPSSVFSGQITPKAVKQANNVVQRREVMGLNPYLLDMAKARIKKADVPSTPMAVPTSGSGVPPAAPIPPPNAAPVQSSPAPQFGQTTANPTQQTQPPQVVTTGGGAPNVPAPSPGAAMKAPGLVKHQNA